METDWLKLFVGQRIWSARCQKRIDSDAFRVELNFVNIKTTLFLDSDTLIKASIVKDYKPKSESGWSDEKFAVFSEHEDNELIKRTFHKLWTEATTSEKYNKDDWKRLAVVLYDAGYQV